jgi:hypothetical protein
MLANAAVIIGEEEAGRSAKVRATLEVLVKNISKSTLDIAELLQEVKSRGYYHGWGYNTFTEYVSELDVKARKAQYLVRIVDVMNDVEIPRATYEPLGLSKLREITSLNHESDYVDPKDPNQITPMSELIVDLVNRGRDMSLDEVKDTVRTLKGLVGENEIVWMNFGITKAAKEKTIVPALELMKQHIGSVGYDDEGMAVDSSDGKALEYICAEYINDPNNSCQV